MKHGLVRLAALAGAAALGLFLCRAGSRDVVLVYDLRGVDRPTALGVRIERGAEVYRDATFVAPGGQVRHPVKLPDGTYRLRYGVDRAGADPLRGEREIQVSESQTIVLSLAP